MKMTTYKLVVVGNANSGKTSLINRYISDTFSSQMSCTIGIEFDHKELNDETRLVIWDTAGQERFQSVGSALFRGADVMMFVYDVSNVDSFNGLENWYRQYLTYGDQNAIKILIGNKIDLEHVVRSEDAKSWAVGHDMVYEEASAKNSKGVHAAFSTVISQLNKLPRVQKEKLKIKQMPKTDRCCF